MFFKKELNKIKRKNNNKKIAIFIDMDGVIADYRIGEGENIKNNIPGTYLNKRPIFSVIKILNNISNIKGFDLYVLSSCLFIEQKIEKNKWLKKYVPFIDKKKHLIVISKNFENRKIMKINKIKEKINSGDCDLVILIDDTHEILFLAKEILMEKVIPYHIITILD